ncbi:hypothetical protein [Rhizobium sp. SYY.PMSO]|uniref:hypothetical protein n=1 Tax=Rhizobium sp. SYY.PMSO TaxID=3382192 RepID=UPI00398FA716
MKTARLLVTVGFRARVVATRFGLSGLLVISTRSGLADIDATSLRLPASWTLSAPNARRFPGAVAFVNVAAGTAYHFVLGGRACSGRFQPA